MARPRSKETDEANPIPEEYRELIGDLAHDPAYIRAWQHAHRFNPESNKACMVYADNHWQEYEQTDAA